MRRRNVFRVLALTVTLVIGVAVGGAWAQNPFTDVPANNSHASAIDAIYDAGISLGCATDRYCPSEFVRRDQMASFLARTAALGPNRFPVANARGREQTYCTLSAASPGAFDTAPCRPTTRLVAPATFGSTSVIPWTEVDVENGFDGLPILAHTTDAGDMKVSRCLTATCSGPVTQTAMVNSNTGPARHIDLAIGADGLPLIAYFDSSALDLKVMRCFSTDCDTGTSVSTIDAAGDVGQDLSLVIGFDGMPMISYYDATNSSLKFARCSAVDCASSAAVTIDNDADVGRQSAIALSANGLPMMSYYDVTNGNLLFARCPLVTCTGGRGEITPQILDAPGNVGRSSSLTVGGDGFPIVTYHDDSQLTLKVAHCQNAGCTSAIDRTLLDPAATAGSKPSIAIGTDGLPIIAYLDSDDRDLVLAKCTTKACTGSATLNILDAGFVTGEASLTVGVDGIPVIGYTAGVGNVTVLRPAVS